MAEANCFLSEDEGTDGGVIEVRYMLTTGVRGLPLGIRPNVEE